MKLHELKGLYPYFIAKKYAPSTFSFKYRMYYLGTERAVVYENELINHYDYIEGNTIKDCYIQLDNYARGKYYNGKLFKEVIF